MEHLETQVASILEVGTDNFLSVANSAGLKIRPTQMSYYVKPDVESYHFSVNTSDLNLYNGNTKIDSVETVLTIGDNPTYGGVSSGGSRSGNTVTVTDIADLDGISSVAYKWWRSVDDGSNWTQISGETGKSYTLTNTDADFDV